MFRGRKPLPPFPASVLFGAGNSDSQCEAYDPRYPDIRDVWYARRRLQERGRATDFWQRYPEDIALARGLGCQLFRFSIAWARIEPEPGVFNDEALDHYSDVVDAIIAAGMEPYVTLCHFVWPLHVESRGGVIADGFPADFTRYATRVAQRLGSRVRYWSSFNEPNILAFGFIKPWWERAYFAPPGLPPDATAADQIDALNKLMRNLFVAHTDAREAIKALNPDALLGANPALLGLPVWLQRWMDGNVIKRPSARSWQGQAFAERKLQENGRLDVIVAMLTKTDDRASQLDFGEVYFMSAQRILVLAGSPAQSTVDLVGRRIAVTRGSTAADTLRREMKGSLALVVEDRDEAIAALTAGAADAFLADETLLTSAVQDEPGRFRMLADRLTSEPYGPAVAKGNPQFLDAVNRAVLGFIQSGRWAESVQRHLGLTGVEPPRLPTLATLADMSGRQAGAEPHGSRGADGDLLERVRQRGVIRIGVPAAAPGFGVRSEDGTWSGVEVDIARAIADEVLGPGGRLELYPVKTSERIGALRSLARLFDPLLKIWGILATTCTTSWWNLGMAGELPDYICPKKCVGACDYIAFDYYWGLGMLSIKRLVGLFSALAAGRMEEAPVWPRALYHWLKELGRKFPNHPLIIVENGCVTEADGIDQATYLRRHLAQVQQAVAEGVNVHAYVGWSITTNRELGHRLSPSTDFGLFRVDLDNDPDLVRHPTAAGAAYAEVIRTRQAHPVGADGGKAA